MRKYGNAIYYTVVSIITLILSLVNYYQYKHGGSIKNDRLFIAFISTSIVFFIASIVKYYKVLHNRK
jgi:hypothetical protein